MAFLRGEEIAWMPVTLPVPAEVATAELLKGWVVNVLTPQVEEFLEYPLEAFAPYAPCGVEPTPSEGVGWHFDPFTEVSGLIGLKGTADTPVIMRVGDVDEECYLQEDKILLYSGKNVFHMVPPPVTPRKVCNVLWRAKGEIVPNIDNLLP